jgi:hypothetical protein
MFTSIGEVGVFERIFTGPARWRYTVAMTDRDRAFENCYTLAAKVDDSPALADDFKVFAYEALKKIFQVKRSKEKKLLRKVLLKAATQAIEGYYVAVDGRECLKHQGVQCDDGPSPQKKLRLKKVIAPSSSCVAAAAPTAEISKVVPRGMLTKDVYRPERKSPPKVTSNLRGMMSLGKQVSSPVRSPNKKSVWLV